MPIKSKIRNVPNHPKPGVMFRDITTLLKDAAGFRDMQTTLLERYKDSKIDKVIGIESRGFIIGAPLAVALGVGFVPMRKKGKLPAETVGYDYELEYGTDRIELHTDAITPGERILLIDDLIATGGTAEAGCKLIQMMQGEIIECAFVIDLPFLGGRQRLEKMGQKVYAMCAFEDEE